MHYETIKVTSKEAEKLLLDYFNVVGVATPLPGELDLNFKIKTKENNQYILKVSRPGEEQDELQFQQDLLLHVNSCKSVTSPQVIKDIQGNTITHIKDSLGHRRSIRLLSWISGRMWSQVNPQTDSLRYDLGRQVGSLTQILYSFKHVMANRTFDWDIAQSLWTKKHLHLFQENQRAIIVEFQESFTKQFQSYESLRKSVVHNDANDNNIVVCGEGYDAKVKSLIDYGDATYTQTINDLAVACAYAIMHQNDPLAAALPLIKGYHESFPLKEEELKHLYVAIAMRLVISVTKSAINKEREPENKYLLISEQAAWDLLNKWHAISAEFAHYRFREACSFTAHPNEEMFYEWAAKKEFNLSAVFPTVSFDDCFAIDLSVSSLWIGHQHNLQDLDLFKYKIKKLQNEHPDKVIAGGYLEPRILYDSEDYDHIGNNGAESRTIHLGVDYWLPSQTPVHAFLDGEVVISHYCGEEKDYGGLIVLKHQAENFEFYTLYGHLSLESINNKEIGQYIEVGECIGQLGDFYENGNWPDHLHFQILLSTLNFTNDFPGVAFFSEIETWKSICPNLNALFKNKGLHKEEEVSNEELITFRKQYLGKSLSLQYKQPIRMVRGSGQYLLDQYGTKYLDTVNNVAHVGHEHFDVVSAGQAQMALINTNSRYLHENINELAKELLDTLPPELSVLHFVNSGSEANELAIRMVKAFTGQKDIIASEMGYHGNTNMCIDISSYKFDGNGGEGAPEHTHIIPLPDTFRGKYQGENSAQEYANEVKNQINIIHKKGRKVGAFIIEPIISCGGQIELPEGFLAQAYNYIRKAGGLCISDEVQTGCGRMGETFWGFQLHHVIPDIVTIGKPLGNGHPLAAVACTPQVATAFANGMEYFNTFGGNPVSCTIGTEVLRVVKREDLQRNALEIGNFLKIKLKELALTYSIIGDVRGKGLFLGVELVDKNKSPLPKQTAYLADRMKDYSILMSIDGPDLNVLKVKPPLVFTIKNAKDVLTYLEKILQEDFMRVL